MQSIKLAPIFTSNCVLQRDKEVRIFGTASGERTLELSMTGPTELSLTAKSVDDHFMFLLPRTPAGGPYVITIRDGVDHVQLDNVFFGDVYLAGGQSNMEFELQNEKYWKNHTEKDVNPNVRFYYTLKSPVMDEAFFAEEAKTRWELAEEDGMKRWSAVGYYFADKLSKELGITVGIIGCNWGATSASCWIGKDDMLADPVIREYVDEYEAGLQGKTQEEQIREYEEFEEYHKDWEKKAAECYAENPYITWDEVQERCGVCKWPGPLNCRSPFRPGGLYETMIKRIAPYSMKGVLWYQGENDTNKPELYEKLLTKLILVWRQAFQNDDLFFYVVQLAMHRYLPEVDTKNWPIVREAQYKVCREMRNCRLVLALDYSMIKDIHPVTKKVVGERLCDAVTGRYRLPVCHKHEMDGSRVRLYFDQGPLSLLERRPLGMGGKILSDDELWEVIRETDAFELGVDDGTEEAKDKIQRYFSSVRCFELAGEDGEFHPAFAEITGEDEIMLYSAKVVKPKTVRYAWSDFVIVNLFTMEGYPVMPFQRTLR